MNQLIIGYGQVGRAIASILNIKEYIDNAQPGELKHKYYDVLHICIPYNKTFMSEVVRYTYNFAPKLVIIHSTVPIGTTSKLGAVHSPIRGVHPNLVKGIKTFPKYFGGVGARKAAAIFSKKGIKVKVTDRAENTEAMKLWDTTQYGAMIMLNKEIYEFCDMNGLDFDFVYTEANISYNEGYSKLGRKEVVRPVLKYIPGEIGGHCVLENANLLDSPTAKRLKNKLYAI